MDNICRSCWNSASIASYYLCFFLMLLLLNISFFKFNHDVVFLYFQIRLLPSIIFLWFLFLCFLWVFYLLQFLLILFSINFGFPLISIQTRHYYNVTCTFHSFVHILETIILSRYHQLFHHLLNKLLITIMQVNFRSLPFYYLFFFVLLKLC